MSRRRSLRLPSKAIASLLHHATVALALAALTMAGGTAGADSLAVMPPLGLGPHAVACSNVQQDFTRLPPGADVQAIWEGKPQSTGPSFITDLLTDPAHAFVLDVAVPDDSELYGDYAGHHLVSAAIVCHPTSADDPRAAYALPNGRAVPHMQVGADAPIWPDATTRFPLLVFATGLGGSPLSQDYLSALGVFASYGYVVVAPFLGDARIADIRLEDFNDVLDALLHFRTFIAMQSLRVVELETALDAVLAHPDYRDRIDPARIGGFGASLGAESVLLMTGARLTTSIGQSSKTVLADPRLKGIVGYVPYFGQPFYPAFGRDQDGLSDITVPFLGISGTADTTAPVGTTEQGVRRLRGSRELVTLEGVQHGFDVASTQDIFTWSLVFLAAHVLEDKAARVRLTRMQSVAGGGDDRTRVDYTAPLPPGPGERSVIEYHRDANDHYFVTAEPEEAAMLDAGVVVPGWSRTGYDFKAWAAGSANGLATCRFFGTPGIGPDSHFYTLDPAECAQVKDNPMWTYEGLAFNAFPLVAGDCPPDRIPIVRLYNNGLGGQANHRYLTSRSEIANTLARGWILEGPVFCGLP